MTTEQMDWLDDERAGRHKDTASRRRAEAELTPVILYGTPSREQIAEAMARSQNGVLVVPKELDPRTTTEAEADDNAVRARIEMGFRGDRDSIPDDDEQRPVLVNDWKAVADSCDNLLRAVLAELGFEADTDPIYAARKRMAQLEGTKSISVDDETMMAEEPIEQRLRRAWLNGFREGFERGAYIGQPDHH